MYYFLILVLFAPVVSALDNSGCVFDLLYDKGMAFDKSSYDGRFQRSPFALFSLNDQFKTKRQCIEYCKSEGWCVAVSNYPTEDIDNKHLCQFHTDKHLLGMIGDGTAGEAFKCRSQDKQHDFQCELEDSMIFNIDGRPFSTLDATAYGASPNEIIMPSRIISFEQEEGVFCEVVKTDNDMFHGKAAPIYSEYYGNIVGYPLMWTFPTDYERKDKLLDGGPSHYFHKSSVNPYVSGYPITAIRKFNVIPQTNNGNRGFVHPEYSHYNYWRHEYLMQPECIGDFDEQTDNLIDREAAAGTEEFFVRSVIDFKNNKFKYMSAGINPHDEQTALRWHDDSGPATRFRIGTKIFNSDPIKKQYGYDNVVLGYDNTGKEVGWLDRNNCNSDSEDGNNGGRVVPNGKRVSTDNGIHCGTKNWNLVRQSELRVMATENFNRPDEIVGDSAGIGGGSMLTVVTGYRHNNILPIQTAVTPMSDLKTTRGEVCSLFIEIVIGHNRHICSGHGHRGANAISLEKVEPSYDTDKLFSIYNNINHDFELVCDLLGHRRCIWRRPRDIQFHQLFKEVNNYVSTPVSNPSFSKTEKNNFKQHLSVYERHGGVWSNIGYVTIDKDSKVVITDDMKNASIGIRLDNTRSGVILGTGFSHLKTEGISVGDQAIFTEHATGATIVSGNVTMDGRGKMVWVTDGTTKCPDGYYVHQIRCKKDQLCSEYDLGCVKVRERSCSLNNVNTTTVPLSQDDFVKCPEGSVIIGRTNKDITCAPLTITPHKPASHVFPKTTSIGGLVKRNPNGIPSTTVHPSDKNWVGTPIQAFVMKESEIDVWHYGTTCIRSPSGFDPSKLVRDIGINQVTDAPRSCSGDQYVSFIQCQQDDCTKGINLFCTTAQEHCQVTGAQQLIRSQVGSNQVPVCPSGMAMVGLGCVHRSPDGLTPCAEIEIVCKQIDFDPHFVPPAPSPSGGGGTSGETKTIIISLSVGIPLIIVAAIACLCCIPESPNDPTSGSYIGVAYTEYDVVKDDYDTLRRRNKFILNGA